MIGFNYGVKKMRERYDEGYREAVHTCQKGLDDAQAALWQAQQAQSLANRCTETVERMKGMLPGAR